MSINRVHQKDSIRSDTSVNQIKQLKPGQVVTGRIQKIYPNQKAMVSLGQTQLIARLEAPLTKDNSYYFEVGYESDTIVLKMINKLEKQLDTQNITQLLKTLGQQHSKKEVQFLQELIKNNVLFTKAQLREALPLLNKFKNIANINQVLLDMIRENTPLNTNIINARVTQYNESLQHTIREGLIELNTLLDNDMNRKSTSIGSLTIGKTIAKQFINNIKESLLSSNSSFQLKTANFNQSINENKQLILNIKSKLEILSNRSVSSQDLFNSEIEKAIINNKRLFTMLKSTGKIPEKLNLEQWANKWSEFAHTEAKNNEKQRSLRLPYNLEKADVINGLRQQQSFSEIVATFESKWSQSLNASIKGSELKTKNFRVLLQEFKKLVELSGLNPEIIDKLDKLIQNQAKKAQIVQVMKDWLVTNQSHVNLELKRPMNELFQYPNERQAIVSFMKRFINESGMLNEYNLVHSNEGAGDLQQTLKAQILQLMQGHHRSDLEHLPKLVHIINGMQLQSVLELNHVVHAVLQLPGEPLGFKQDIQLEFSSKCNEDGELDSNHCRVLFYLELANLEDTVIDMNIQNRMVMLTIFNDSPHLQQLVGFYKNTLEEALQSINYQLQTINVQGSKVEGHNAQLKMNLYENHNYEGYDYKI